MVDQPWFFDMSDRLLELPGEFTGAVLGHAGAAGQDGKLQAEVFMDFHSPAGRGWAVAI